MSVSTGHEDEVAVRHVAYSEVVRPDDAHRLIRIVTDAEDTAVAEFMVSLPDTLPSLRIAVSTGKVVDFRSRECLSDREAPGSVPLICPGNLRDGLAVWPRDIRKAQWFQPITEKDRKMLVPEGWYCVVKRFSSKEERRRIVAAVWSPDTIGGPIAFENHVNVFHDQGAGLDRSTAYGLSIWLNSSFVDRFFRTFSGHTQVNATDLRAMRYPDLPSLRELGTIAPEHLPEQGEIDDLVRKVLGVVGAGS